MMDQQQRESIGAEIGRVRTIRPRITITELAEAAGLAENTVSAVIRGTSNDVSVGKVLAALGALGRPVEVVAADDTTAAGVAHPTDLIVDLVRVFLRSAPPAKAQELERVIWMLLRGQLDEVVAGLPAPPVGK